MSPSKEALIDEIRELRPVFQKDYPILLQLDPDQRALVDRLFGETLKPNEAGRIDPGPIVDDLYEQIGALDYGDLVTEAEENTVAWLRIKLVEYALACLVDELLAERGYFPADMLQPPAQQQAE
jgi:hypothetical protein